MYDNNKQMQFLDLLNIASFCVGLMNLDQNLTQNDKQELQNELNNKIDLLLKEIHGHLKMQDEKIDKILSQLEVNKNDS